MVTMLKILPGLLTPATVQQVLERLQELPFVDGRLSAGGDARRVKNNQEADPQDTRIAILNRLVLLPLYQSPLFQAAALPKRLSGAFFARYRPGMAYGSHVDDPIMGPEGGRYRSDLSVTLFLNAPDAYVGGELTIETDFGDQRIKLSAGDAVLYPASSLHHVTPVSAGERLVAVAWVESMVRDPGQRQILFDLHQVEEGLRQQDPESPLTRKASQIRANLLRRWADVS
jgi:PKHD-type hydroxylase